MKVFISWSGSRSQQTALVLREWLPQVLQSVDPWMSTEDIDKGARSTTEIKRALADAAFGVVCVTRENVRAPWLNFEAGALSKEVADSRNYVAPFLLDMEPEDITGPLVDFQVTKFNETDVRRMMAQVNSLLPSPLSDGRFDTSFSMWWPVLEKKLTDVLNSTQDIDAPPRSVDDMLGEILATLRSQRRQVTTATTANVVVPSRVDGSSSRNSLQHRQLIHAYIKDLFFTAKVSPYRYGWRNGHTLDIVTETPLSPDVMDEITRVVASYNFEVVFDLEPWLGADLAAEQADRDSG